MLRRGLENFLGSNHIHQQVHDPVAVAPPDVFGPPLVWITSLKNEDKKHCIAKSDGVYIKALVVIPGHDLEEALLTLVSVARPGFCVAFFWVKLQGQKPSDPDFIPW